MRSLRLIGIGTGDPRQLTQQAITALGELDIALILDKRADTQELSAIRDHLLNLYAAKALKRVHLQDPPRRAQGEYLDRVKEWHLARVSLIEETLDKEAASDAVIGILVWGDPAFYDSTLRIAKALRHRAEGRLELDVIPGISSIQLLAAAFALPLNALNGAIHVTTGRRLRDEGFPLGQEEIIVMLDGDCSFLQLDQQQQEGVKIYWGAYLGSADECLIQGALAEVGEHIRDTRARLRMHKGWLMDTYLLKRSLSPGHP